MTNRISRRAAACAFLATTALCCPTLAYAETPAPSFIDTLDDHGVDLVTGLPFLSIEEGGIGSGPGRVAMQRIWAEGAGFQDNWTGGLYDVTVNSVTKKYVQFAGISDTFSGSGTAWTSDKAEGSTLLFDSGANRWVYTTRDGTVVQFENTGYEKTFNCPGVGGLTCKPPVSITRPDGLKFTLVWETARTCEDLPGEPCARVKNYNRLSSVTSSAGYKVTFAYSSNVATYGMLQSDPWFQRATATFGNSANPPSPAPTITYAYPSSSEVDVTDPAGRIWKFFLDASGRLTGVRRPGSAGNNIAYGYGADGTASSSTKDGVTNSYGRSLAGSTATETRTDPLTHQRVVVSDINVGRPSSDKDELNRTTGYTYDTSARLTKITAPEGNYVQYGYDSRGNVTSTTNVAKSGSGLANIGTSASFDATCANLVKCNKPNTTTDAKGNVTNYAYDAVHGGVISITEPAPAAGGVRPETRYSYTQVTSASGDLVYMLTKVAACQTLASCANAADETQVTAGYNSNLLPTTVTRRNGTGTLSAASTMTYDPRGNLLTVDRPLTGTADTTAYKYDAADQRIGAISSDPDGGGTLKNRAIRLTYRPDGQVSKQELGTTAGQTDANFAAMTVSETVDVTFDSNSRPTQQKLSASGTAYALTQTSYDTLGRVDCQAVRMNTAVYGSLPASACTLSTQGSFGPDRIGQNIYDAASELTQVKVGVGTADAATERTLAYSNNGVVSSLKDGENNLTTYEYDGFDRASKIRYPNPAKGAGTSSATDYEQLGYDANSNVASRRLRDGTSIAFTYDNLDRVTLKNLPGAEPDVSYSYDNLGRITSASQTGNSLSFTYDALSRRTDETGPLANVHSDYDLAGRRTALTTGPGYYVGYEHLVTGELSKALSSTGIVYASYAYDDLGRPTSVTFDNGTSTSWSYDPVSRLSSITNDLAGTANDLTIGSMAYNPAAQIVSENKSNSSYSWNGAAAANGTYTSNGLNEYLAAGAANVTYDAKGNLTSDGTNTFTYSSENRLTSSPGATLSYDPLGRLYQITTSSGTRRFFYDGLNVFGEISSTGTVFALYVQGEGIDEPLVWFNYEGGAVRRFLHADERGSIVAVSDDSGNPLSINSYDEYGIPGSGNAGRFQYTGQMWLGEVGLYNYKNRFYSPTLGRFMQTDPIGQDGGPNLYAYVGDDPLNAVDPLGLTAEAEPPIIIPACANGGSYPNCYEQPGPAYIGPAPGIGGSGGCVGDCRPIVVTGKRRPRTLFVMIPGVPLPINICPLVGLLGDKGRLRVGADAAGGYFGFIRAGVGVSLRGDASLEFDAYLGGGIGIGGIIGAGLGYDNAGGTSGGGQTYSSRELCASGGYIITGTACAPSSSVSRPNVDWSGTNGGLGGGVGPKAGVVVASTKTGNASFRTPGLC